MNHRLLTAAVLLALVVSFVVPPSVARAGPEEGSFGAIHASLQTGLLAEADLMRDAMLDRTTGFSAGLTPSAPGTWLRLLRSGDKWTGEGAVDYDRTLYGGLVGWDGASDGWQFGVTAGMTRGEHVIAAYESTAESTTTHAGAYAARVEDARGWVFGFSFGAHTLATGRPGEFSEPGVGPASVAGGPGPKFGAASFVPLVELEPEPGPFTGTHRAEYGARTVQVFGEWNRTIREQDYTWQPFVGVAWRQLALDAFAESGEEGPLADPPWDDDLATALVLGSPIQPLEVIWDDEGAALSADAATLQLTTADVGIRVASVLDSGSIPAVVYGAIAWRQLFGPAAPTVDVSRDGFGASSVTGAPFGSGLTLGAGLNLRFSDTWSFDMAYEGRLGPVRDQRFVLRLAADF